MNLWFYQLLWDFVANDALIRFYTKIPQEKYFSWGIYRQVGVPPKQWCLAWHGKNTER